MRSCEECSPCFLLCFSRFRCLGSFRSHVPLKLPFSQDSILLLTSLVKHEKQGFFCAVDAVVVSQIRDLLHSTRVYLSDKLLGLENKRQKTSFISWLNTLKSSAVIQRRTWTMFYQQSLSHVWEMFKRNCGQRKPCCSSSRKVPRWSIYWPHTLSLHFRLLLQTKRSNWCIKSHEDPMKKIIDISVAWNLLKKKL